MKMFEDLEYVSVAETKAKLSEKVNSASRGARRYAITSHGKPKAVILGYKEYCGLIEYQDPKKTKEISLEEWKRSRKGREKIIDSVASLFDVNKLSRKGQKGYKKLEVERLEKTRK